MRSIPNNDKKKMITGSAWMTLGSITSRIMGAIYIIPWGLWLGSNFSLANSLFAKGYNVYSLFLIISTAGIPGALSKQIAHYDAIGEMETSNRLFKDSLFMMLGLGVFSAVIMWLIAPLLAFQNGEVDIRMISIIHALCWPLTIIPAISILRGLFQGRAQMGPSAVSQLVEQFARIGYMLLATYVIMVSNDGNYVRAVAHSTFAAFVGAVCVLVYLLIALKKQIYFSNYEALQKQSQIQRKLALVELCRQSFPFVILDSAIILYQFLDQYMFPIIMKNIFKESNETINYLYGLFGFNSNKLTMIVISLSTAMAVTAIPLLSKSFSRNDYRDLSKKIVSSLKLFFFIMIPGSVGMICLAHPLYRIFYRSFNYLGIHILELNAAVANLIGLFILLVAIMQAVHHSRLAIKYFAFGVIAKMLAEVFCIWFFESYGPLVATAIGLGVSSFFMLKRLIISFDINLRPIFKYFLGVTLLTIIMASILQILKFFIYNFLGKKASSSILILITSVIVGILVYGFLSLKTRAADEAFGFSLNTLRSRFQIS